MRKIVSIGFVLLLLVAGAAAQGHVGVTARVLPAWQMEVVKAAGDANYSVTPQVVSRESVVLLIERRSEHPAPVGQVHVVLALRTNAASFSVDATANGTVHGIELATGTPTAGGNGQQLSDDALARFRGIANSKFMRSDEETIARGGRISARGNFRSADNAILVPLRISIPATDDPRRPIRISLRIDE